MSLYGDVTIPGGPDLENIRKLDLLAIPQICRMQRLGFAIDLERLAELSLSLASEMDELQKDISSYIPPDALGRFVGHANEVEEETGLAEFNANSADQIRTLLFDLLRVGSLRDVKVTATGKKSTGKKQLELCRDDHPVVPLVLQYRERSKLKSAFADSLPKLARLHPRSACCPICELPHVEATYRVHGEIMTTRTETGRLSMKKPNLMQIPVRSELGQRIRAAFIASPGCTLVSTDFSQMELRDLAHMANAESMIQVYREDKDIHLYTACRAFGRDYDYYAGLSDKKDAGTLTDTEKAEWKHFSLYERLPSKNLNFMIVYGASWKGLQAQLALSGIFWDEQQCKDFIARWFGLYPEVEEYLGLQEYRARRYGFVWTPFGRVRYVPETESCHNYIRSAGIRQAGNMPIQGCNADQLKLVMGELEQELECLYRRGIYCWGLAPIHDQIIVECEESAAELIGSIMSYIFSRVMHDEDTGENLWRVPIRADAEISERWVKQ